MIARWIWVREPETAALHYWCRGGDRARWADRRDLPKSGIRPVAGQELPPITNDAVSCKDRRHRCWALAAGNAPTGLSFPNALLGTPFEAVEQPLRTADATPTEGRATETNRRLRQTEGPATRKNGGASKKEDPLTRTKGRLTGTEGQLRVGIDRQWPPAARSALENAT